MKEVTEYRAGQRVRIEGATWAVEGYVIERDGLALVVTSPHAFYDLALCEKATGVTVTVLAEPRPEEPTGLGAVVEDKYGGYWIRADLDPNGDHTPWREVLPGTYVEDDAARRTWRQIVDPVVLHEGWTP